MEMPEVAERGAREEREAVVAAVAVEIGVEAGADGQAEFARSEQRRIPERALGGDVDEVGTLEAPEADEAAACGKTEAEEGVAGNGDRAEKFLAVESVDPVVIKGTLARAIDGDGVTAMGETLDEMAQRHGDAVDLGRKGFG